MDLVARQVARAAGERQTAFLEAIDAIGNLHRLDDILLDQHDVAANAVEEIIHRSVQNTDADWAVAPQYAFTERDVVTSHGKRTTKTYQVTMMLSVQVLIERLVHIPVRALIHDVGPALLSSLALFAVGFPLMKLLSAAGVPALLTMVTVSAVGLGLYAAMMRTLFHAAWDDLMLVCRTVIPRRPARQRRPAAVNPQPNVRSGEPISRSHAAR